MRKCKLVSTAVPASLVALFLAAGMTQAGIGDQLVKLLPTDGDSGDFFGIAVAISGTTAIVGAEYDEAIDIASGSAYLFDTSTGVQIAKLVPSDGSFDNFFGHSVAISGMTAIVGAPGNDYDGNDRGAAYIFDTTTGLQVAKLINSSSVRFGNAVGISGTTAIVGAPFSGPTLSGRAYLFDTTTGLQIAKLGGDPGPVGSSINAYGFGYSVAICGTSAIVGSAWDDDNGSQSGSAYLFDTTTGARIAKLLPSDGTANDRFGISVAISGTTAIVGAHFDDDNGSDSGSAYLFDTSTGLQIAKLLPNDPAACDEFGISVAISGTTAIVGAHLEDGNGTSSGSAYLFDISTGVQIAKLLSSDGVTFDEFGISVAISNATAAIGAFGHDDNGADSGSAYLFDAALPASLTSDVTSISLSTGGTQVLTLEAGATQAGWFYFTFGSVTGTAPGIDFGGGVVLPLNFDAYMSLTIFQSGLSAFGNFIGILDGAGHAVATFTLPALMDPSLVGVTINHAYLANAVFGGAEFASNAVPVLLAP